MFPARQAARQVTRLRAAHGELGFGHAGPQCLLLFTRAIEIGKTARDGKMALRYHAINGSASAVFSLGRSLGETRLTPAGEAAHQGARFGRQFEPESWRRDGSAVAVAGEDFHGKGC